jgi:[ribosomal protein S5]-alanine N-acetyltransferase
MPPDILETPRLVLRPIGLADIAPIFETYAQDDVVTRYLIWRPHGSRSETEAYVTRCLATPPEIERTYMLVGRDDGAVRGCFALRRPAPHRFECGYLLARK